MTTHSCWTEKVALNIITLLLTVNITSWTQSSPVCLNKKITLICESILLEDFLEQLSQQSNVNFIYSSNIIDLKQPVSFSFYQECLHDVLNQVATHLNLAFKQQENHVIVKGNSIAANNLAVKKEEKNHFYDSFRTKDSLLTIESPVPKRKFIDYDKLPVLNSYSVTIKNPPLTTFAPSLLNKHTSKIYPELRLLYRWHTTVSLFVNEYSGGIEIQSGIPLIRGVLNMGKQYNGNYNIEYGVGSFLGLSSKLSFQMVYTFSRIKQNTDYYIGYKNVIYHIDNENSGYEIVHTLLGLKINYCQHRIKPMFQYTLNNKITIKAGPSFSLLKVTNSQLSVEGLVSRSSSPASQAVIMRSFGNTITSERSVNVNGAMSVPDPLSTIQIDIQPKFRVGLELGISYPIKIFSNK